MTDDFVFVFAGFKEIRQRCGSEYQSREVLLSATVFSSETVEESQHFTRRY